MANVVRELSKCIYSATMVAYKEMQRVPKFELLSESYCLKVKPRTSKENWDLAVYSESN
jgi:hypothetical protein